MLKSLQLNIANEVLNSANEVTVTYKSGRPSKLQATTFEIHNHQIRYHQHAPRENT